MGKTFFHENKQKNRKKKFLILYSLLFGILFFLIFLDFLHSKTTENTNKTEENAVTISGAQESKEKYSFKLENREENTGKPQNVTSLMKELVGSPLFPKTQFESWTGFSQIEIPPTRNKYYFKTDYTVDEVRDFAKNLAVSEKITKYGNTIFTHTIGQSGQLGSILFFETHTGYFHYTAFPGVELPESGSDINVRIYALLKKLNIYDDTLQITGAYKKKSVEGSTYYEIKRNWAIAGLPIYNPIGLLNIPESAKLNELNFNSNSSHLNTNSDIYETTDQTDGYERRSDFNTLTIQVSEPNGRILSMISSLRKVALKSTDQQIISYTDAVDLLQKNTDSFILATPGGDGPEVPWEKIYPDQKAVAQNAQVTESTLAYLEQSPGIMQLSLEPFYIFRGTADLKSGYKTAFIAAVPATKQIRKNTSFNFFDFIPAVHAAQNDTTQKQSLFNLITATPNLTPTPEVNFALVNCYPRLDELNPHYELRSYSSQVTGTIQNVTFGFSHRAIINGQITYSRHGWWYMIPAPNSDVNILKYDYEKVLLAIKSIVGIRDYRAFLNVLGQGVYTDFQQTGSACPIRITGESPTIFIYADPGAEIGVEPYSRITYSDPSLDDDGRWNVKVNEGGSLWVNSSYSRDYLYYEYNPSIKFQRPNKGWNINKEDIEEFVKNNISLSLKLNEKETERTIFEIRHAAENIDNNNIFIGIINKKEIDDKLPLKVTGKDMKIIRIHFYVGEVGKEDMNEPEVDAIKRDKNMLIEIGGWGG